MKRQSLLLFFLLCCSVVIAQVRVACIGNSITYGHGIADRDHDSYPAQLQKLLGKEYDVRNFGVSGTTAQREGDYPWVSTDEYAKAKAFMPQIAVIKLGTNDSKPQNWVGTERFIADVEALASEFESLDSRPRIIIALPAKAYSHGWNINDDVIAKGQIKQLRKMAKRHKWDVVNIYKATSGKANLFPDGIHPNEEGAGLIAKEVGRVIRMK